MSATLIRTPLNWRGLMATYALAFSFVWGVALGASGGDFRPAAFLNAVQRSASLAMDMAGVRVMSAEAYARGELNKQAVTVEVPWQASAMAASLQPELKLYVPPTPTPVVPAPNYAPMPAE